MASRSSTASSWKKGAPEYRWAALEGLSGDLPRGQALPTLTFRGLHQAVAPGS